MHIALGRHECLVAPICEPGAEHGQFAEELDAGLRDLRQRPGLLRSQIPIMQPVPHRIGLHITHTARHIRGHSEILVMGFVHPPREGQCDIQQLTTNHHRTTPVQTVADENPRNIAQIMLRVSRSQADSLEATRFPTTRLPIAHQQQSLAHLCQHLRNSFGEPLVILV